MIRSVNSPKRDHCAIARQYEQDIIAGRIPLCEIGRQAIDRQIRDMRTYAESGDFIFSVDEGNRACKFIELLTHTKGPLKGQRIKLEPWQCWILTTIFGWRRRSDGGRRFRRVYIEVPRGNGKSATSSAVALYCLLADREPGAEVYSFATTRDQAGIVFGDAKQMCVQSPELREHFGLQVLAKALYVPGTNSTFQAKSAEGSTLDGLKTHFACIDELHAHKTRAVYDVVETSMGKRLNSLLWVITTAGFDTSGICYEVRSMVCEVLSGKVKDETQFGIIYSIDATDDWKTEEALKKANPNWGVSVMPDFVLPLQKKATVLTSAAGNFKTKHLNVWCSAASTWMNMPSWEACADHTLTPDDFEGQDCYIGLDLGSKNDITAKILIFPQEQPDGKETYTIFGRFYLPEKAIADSKNAQYGGWAEDGYIQTTPGAMTDLSLIEEEIKEDLSRFNVLGIAYDPWQATQLAGNLDAVDAPMVEVRMTVQNLSAPMKSVEALVQDKRLRHNGDPVMDWMMSNVVARVDAKDNVFPRKERYEQKIDGPVALILGMCIAMNEDDDNGGFEQFTADNTFFEW